MLAEYSIGEVTVGENIYTVYSYEDLYTGEPIEFAEVDAYDPDSIKETVELEGKAYPVVVYGTVFNDEVSEITIPASVKQINDNAFTGCNNLENIYFENTEGRQTKPSTGGDLAYMDVTDSEENAEMFTGDYCDYIWSR